MITEYNGFQYDLERPRLRFKGGGAKRPIPAAPVPTAKRIDEEAAQKQADVRRQRVMAMGRAGTLLTEKTKSDTGSASLLGRTS